MNLTGTWHGEYSYDPDEKLPRLPSRPIPFDMTLKQGWFGFLKGSSQDDPKSQGMAEPALVKGRLKGDRLLLVKMHPVLRIIHEGKYQTLEQLAERYGVAMDEFPPSHPHFRCAASLAPDGRSCSGTWFMPETEIHIPGGRGLILTQLTGTWSMKRPD